jgi:hypothetical protein
MSGSNAGRFRGVLRIARRDEDKALRDNAATGRAAAQAGRAADDAAGRIAELRGAQPTNTEELAAHRQRASLRAEQALSASNDLEERLFEQVSARNELLGAVRRRRSIEELEQRRLATQAGLAAHAAQRALDELSSMRRARKERSS